MSVPGTTELTAAAVAIGYSKHQWRDKINVGDNQRSCVTIPWRQLGVPADVCTMVSRSSLPCPSNTASAAQLPSIPLTSQHTFIIPGHPTPLPSPCCQRHVLQRAMGKVGFWGKSWRRVQLGQVVQPPNRSRGDPSHKEMSLLLLPPDDIPKQRPIRNHHWTRS